MPIEEHFSAGGVVYRPVAGGLEVVLCGRERPILWGLPKGTPDPGESPEETALREVREETGLAVSREADLGEIEYWFSMAGVRIHKRVQFFLMSPTGGSIDDHDLEFDQVSWFPADVAMQTLTYSNEVEVLQRALQYLQGGNPAGDPHAAARR